MEKNIRDQEKRDFALQIQNLSVVLENKSILSNINVNFEKNQFATILGRSGCGKSTFLKTLVGEVLLSRGQIKGPERYGYAPQRSPLLPWLNVLDNLRLCRPKNVNRQVFDSRIYELLEEALLRGAVDKKPYALSWGMRSRVNLVRSFLMESPILLMDEPFAGLDIVTQKALHNLTLKLRKNMGSTVIFVTHDLSEALSLADRIMILKSDGSGFCFDEKNAFNDEGVLASGKINMSPDYRTLSKRIYEALSEN